MNKKKNFFAQKIKINGKTVSKTSKPFIVAEVSANHANSFRNLKDIIIKAKNCGADAIKFQTFALDEMTINSQKKIFKLANYFKINSWNNRSLYSLYKEAHLSYSLQKKAFHFAKKNKIICFSSVFDEQSLHFLQSLKTPIYKVASLESLHFPLIQKIKKTGKPLIISTGTLAIKEIKSLIAFLKKINFKKVILCHCVSDYPVKIENANLEMIKYLKTLFDGIIGYSDHTIGITAPIISAKLGAKVIEKHFINLKFNKSLDSAFSSDPEELKTIVKETYISHKMNNPLNLKIKSFNKRFRRSIFSIKDIKAGEKFTKKNIKVVRPNGGLEPRYFDIIINKKSNKKILKNSPIKINHFD